MWPSWFDICKVLFSFWNTRAGVLAEYLKHCSLSKNYLLTAPRPMFKLCVYCIIINPKVVLVLSKIRNGQKLVDFLRGVRRLQDTSCKTRAIAFAPVLDVISSNYVVPVKMISYNIFK
jgi:hypothetical protein